jgi:hypothetical protein
LHDDQAKEQTGQDRTGQDRTGQDRTGQDRTGQDRTGQDRTREGSKPVNRSYAVEGRIHRYTVLSISIGLVTLCSLDI